MNWQIHTREIYPAAQDAPGQFVTVNGFRLHVSRTAEVRGTSIPILLIHGFGVNGGEEWR